MGDSDSGSFDSKNLGLKAQKKLLGKMASKKIAKVFIDETSGKVLDDLYRIAKDYASNKKVAEKLMKDLIKTVIKIGILYRNEKFSSEELAIAESFKKKFHFVVMTCVSFYEVDFTFDRHFLSRSLNECCIMLKQLVVRHLTEKSLNRIDNVFQFFGSPDFLESIFNTDNSGNVILSRIVNDLHKMLEDGTI